MEIRVDNASKRGDSVTLRKFSATAKPRAGIERNLRTLCRSSRQQATQTSVLMKLSLLLSERLETSSRPHKRRQRRSC